MEAMHGQGCWPGQAEGRLVWVDPDPSPERTPIADRPAEIQRLKAALAQAILEIDRWIERQPTIEGRFLLHAFREALQDGAWSGRVTMLIDLHGLPAAAAVIEAARLVGNVMGRSEMLTDRARALITAARWLTRRLSGTTYPADAILLATELSPLELLDRTQPAIMAAGDPGIVGDAPLVWGVEGVAPDWNGWSARLHDAQIQLTPVGGGYLRYGAERAAVIEFARRMKRDGLVKLTSGNVSCRIPSTQLFAITPSGMEYEGLTPADICIMDLDGNLVEGERRPSTESPLHRLAYRRRPDVAGVVHTHSIYASAFACTGQDLPVINTELAGLVGATIRCAPYAPSGTDHFATVALDTLGPHDVAVLFQNHGVMAVGATLAQAYAVAVGLEEAAMIYAIARQVGEPIIIPEVERRRIFQVHHTTYGQPRDEGKEG